MTPSLEPLPHSGTRRRRKKRSQAPVIGWIIIAICLLVLFAIPFLGSGRRQTKRDEAPSAKDTRDLVVSSSRRDPQCDCIRGALKNSSGRIFHDIEIYFRVSDKEGVDLGAVLALTGIVRPHSSVEFQSDRLPPSAQSYSLIEIK